MDSIIPFSVTRKLEQWLVAVDKLPQVYSSEIPKQKIEEVLRVLGCAKIEVQADLHDRVISGT